jgi:hypothetical protein
MTLAQFLYGVLGGAGFGLFLAAIGGVASHIVTRARAKGEAGEAGEAGAGPPATA